MDIKGKLKTFIDKKKSPKQPPIISYLSSADNCTPADYDKHVAVVGYETRKRNEFDEEIQLSKEAQDVVLGTIEPIYFETDSPDVGSHELQKFPDIADIHVINGIRSRLRKQLTIVSRKVSDLIMDKQEACMEEMTKIDKLQKEACLAVALCVDSRKNLCHGKEHFTTSSLHIIANHNKRQRIITVINNLQTIRTLQMTDVQLQKLLKVEDYPGAIQLLLECQTAAATFKHFTCVTELSSKLQETLEMAEQQLNTAVERVVVNFNSNTYTKLYSAYTLLNKKLTLMDQLHMHITSHIHNSAFTIVLGYVELYSSVVHLNNSTCNSNVNITSPQSSFSKMQYGDVCKYIDAECFLACFLDLCRAMWRTLRNYKAIIRWHRMEALEATSLQENACFKQNSDNNADADVCIDESSYVQQKLNHGLLRIWQDVQSKIRTFILASDLAHFKFDDFLKFLDITNRLIFMGEDFCGSKSEALQESIKKQSLRFFQQEHTARLEELHMFLENEAWQVCFKLVFFF